MSVRSGRGPTKTDPPSLKTLKSKSKSGPGSQGQGSGPSVSKGSSQPTSSVTPPAPVNNSVRTSASAENGERDHSFEQTQWDTKDYSPTPNTNTDTNNDNPTPTQQSSDPTTNDNHQPNKDNLHTAELINKDKQPDNPQDDPPAANGNGSADSVTSTRGAVDTDTNQECADPTELTYKRLVKWVQLAGCVLGCIAVIMCAVHSSLCRGVRMRVSIMVCVQLLLTTILTTIKLIVVDCAECQERVGQPQRKWVLYSVAQSCVVLVLLLHVLCTILLIYLCVLGCAHLWMTICSVVLFVLIMATNCIALTLSYNTNITQTHT